MITSNKSQNRAKLAEQLHDTTSEIVRTKFELVREYVSLADMETSASHLDAALDVLSSLNATTLMENALSEYVEVQSHVAAGFLRIGRKTKNRLTLEKAKHAYRGAITLASVLGDDDMRQALRQNYRTTLSLLGDKPQNPSLFKVA